MAQFFRNRVKTLKPLKIATLNPINPLKPLGLTSAVVFRSKASCMGFSGGCRQLRTDEWVSGVTTKPAVLSGGPAGNLLSLCLKQRGARGWMAYRYMGSPILAPYITGKMQGKCPPRVGGTKPAASDACKGGGCGIVLHSPGRRPGDRSVDALRGSTPLTGWYKLAVDRFVSTQPPCSTTPLTGLRHAACLRSRTECMRPARRPAWHPEGLHAAGF